MNKITKKLDQARALFNEKSYTKAIKLLNELPPLSGEALIQKNILRAAIHVRSEEIDEALTLIQAVEQQCGMETEASLNIKAVAYRAKQDLSHAKELLERGIKQFPQSIDLAHNLSVTAADMGDFELAEKAAFSALSINEKYIETYKNLGRVYVTKRDVVKARTIFNKLKQIEPNSIDVLVGLGAVELIESNASGAKEYFTKALAKNDSLNAAWANLGICHKYLGDYPAAKKCLEVAIQKDPTQIEHQWNLSLVNLAMGNFELGWQQYEVRFDPRRIATDAVKLPNTKIPMLKSSDSVVGTTIILVQEQGYGDTFQFFRFAKKLKDEGVKKIIAIVAIEMVDIIRTIPWIDEIRSEMRGVQEIPNFWVFSMSLPARYKLHSVEDIPNTVPYVLVEQERARHWNSLPKTKKMRVGLVWAGRETHSNDANRSITVPLLEPILLLHHEIEFISLQKGPREHDIAGDRRIRSCGSQLHNFSDTAALLSTMDLLISVDSSPVHLAGAMGMPVWTMVPSIFDFRWMIDRTDSPWYPSMRLFRQQQGQSWKDVIANIRKQLEVLLKNPNRKWEPKRYTLHPSLTYEQSKLAGVDLYLNSAFKYHLEGDLNTAEQMYKECLEYNPRSLDALRNLAALYRAKGDLAQSLACYEEGEKQGTADVIFYTNFSNLLMQLGRYNDALSKIRLALQQNPQYQSALVAEIECMQKINQASMNN